MPRPMQLSETQLNSGSTSMFSFDNLNSPPENMDGDEHLKRTTDFRKVGDHKDEYQTEAKENEKMKGANDNAEEEFDMPEAFKQGIEFLLGPAIPERKWTAKDIFGHK